MHGRRALRAGRRTIAALIAVLSSLATAGTATAAETVVSITFDDARQSQYLARAPLAANNMHATFYANSGRFGATTADRFLTLERLRALAADGNEIAGHSLTHQHLTTLSDTDLHEQVCTDRNNLLAAGFTPVASFAYPYAEHDARVRAKVQECGYRSGRAAGGIRSETRCLSCPTAETIPPANPWAIRTVDFFGTDVPLSTMQARVTAAENNGGGWVVLALHDICDNCDPSNASVKPEVFSAFVDWLQLRASRGTVVKTVGQVMGVSAPPPAPPTNDTTAPVTRITCNGAVCSGGKYKNDVTVRLTATDTGSGVAVTRYTTDGSTPTATNGKTYNGAFTLASTATVKFRSWDMAGNAEDTKSQRIRT